MRVVVDEMSNEGGEEEISSLHWNIVLFVSIVIEGYVNVVPHRRDNARTGTH